MSDKDASGKEMVYEIWVELSDLQSTIKDSRSEIAEMQDPSDKNSAGDRGISDAHDELDAIVKATASATDTILDTAEEIQGIVGDNDIPGHIRDNIIEKVTAIFEACSFQDITGQRIQKVVKTLQNIDEKLAKMMNHFDKDGKMSELKLEDDKKKVDVNDLESLKNGPQLEGKGRSQSEVDDLMK